MANKISPGQPLRQQLLPALFSLSVRRGKEKNKKKSSAHAEPSFKYAPLTGSLKKATC